MLSSLEGFTSLKELYLAANQLDSNHHIEALCSKLKNLEIIDLSFNNFNNTDIGSALSGLSSLKSLYLTSCQLSWRSIYSTLPYTFHIRNLHRFVSIDFKQEKI